MKLVCPACQQSYAESERRWQCTCGSYLLYEGIPKPAFDKEVIKERPTTMWRYREALPIQKDENIVSLGEGMTPLVASAWEGQDILFKLDYLCPTGSFKDRGISFFVSKLKELGVDRIIEDSSGNAGAAMAAYCARAGIKCEIYVPADTSAGKCVQVEIYGARLVRVPGSREDTEKAVKEAANEIYYASHNASPYFTQGIKTIAFEIWEQLGWKRPDNVIVPAGQGCLVTGCELGFKDLLAAGKIERMPKIFAVQAANCAPLYQAYQAGISAPAVIAKEETIAEGISSAAPVRGDRVLAEIQASGGAVVAVSEQEIWQSLQKLAGTGIYVEPTSAAATAGLSQLIKAGLIKAGETSIVVLSGIGLKATDKIFSLQQNGL